MEKTDEEVICEWMETRPTIAEAMAEGWSFKWWGRDRKPGCHFDLDRLHEVEARLTDEQKLEYREALVSPYRNTSEMLYWILLHATAAQKIIALSAVIRADLNNKSNEKR